MEIEVISPSFWINKKSPELISYEINGTINPDEYKMIFTNHYDPKDPKPIPNDDEILYWYNNERCYLLNRNDEIK